MPNDPSMHRPAQTSERELLTLALLPSDLLHTILLQRGMGARELCALEATAWLFRQLVDDEAWRYLHPSWPRSNVNEALRHLVDKGSALCCCATRPFGRSAQAAAPPSLAS